METALQVISYFGNVRNIDILIVLVIIFWELEINLLSEEEFKEEVH
jgi:hypothetical protein